MAIASPLFPLIFPILKVIKGLFTWGRVSLCSRATLGGRVPLLLCFMQFVSHAHELVPRG